MHVDAAAETSLGSVSPADCVEFRQTCTRSQDQKHVGALGGVSNTSAPQVHRPEPSSTSLASFRPRVEQLWNEEHPLLRHGGLSRKRAQRARLSVVRVNSDAAKMEEFNFSLNLIGG